MRNLAAVSSAILLLGGCAGKNTPLRSSQAAQVFNFDTLTAKAFGLDMRAETYAASRSVEEFFGRRFRGPVAVSLAATRADFDRAIPTIWGLTPTQCWMVGVGVSDRLIMLSPAAWKTDACDHKAGDVEEFRSILRHELVHVLHGQNNPTGDFTGMDDVAWFVEGLAVVASGQLTSSRLAAARESVAGGEVPGSLGEGWSGKNRYGISGSMVEYVVATHGRGKLTDLLSATSSAAIMARLGTTQPAFMEGWRKWLVSRDSSGASSQDHVRPSELPDGWRPECGPSVGCVRQVQRLASPHAR